MHTVGVKKNGDDFILFNPVETEVKRPFPMPYTRMETGLVEADAMEHAVDRS